MIVRKIKDVEKIESEVKKINKIGLDTRVPIKCKKCSHEWDTNIETNPVNFSLGS